MRFKCDTPITLHYCDQTRSEDFHSKNKKILYKDVHQWRDMLRWFQKIVRLNLFWNCSYVKCISLNSIPIEFNVSWLKFRRVPNPSESYLRFWVVFTYLPLSKSVSRGYIKLNCWHYITLFRVTCFQKFGSVLLL